MATRVSTNQFATAKYIVDTNGISSGATHSTIASALTDAVSGDTIFVKPGTYTEDLTLKAGVNIVSFAKEGYTPNVTIVGKLSGSYAGTATVSGIRLQTNSDYAIQLTGASATILNVVNCYVYANDFTAINITGASCKVIVEGSYGEINDVTATYVVATAGAFQMRFSQFRNSASSAVASTFASANFEAEYSLFYAIVTTSGTASLGALYIDFEGPLNTTRLTIGGSGTNQIRHGFITSGTAVAVTCSTTLSISNTTIVSSNANPLGGAGTVTITNVLFPSASGSGVNPTTLVAGVTYPGISRSATQPAFLANQGTSDLNVTGDSTAYTLGDTDVGTALTEIFDQNGDFTAGASGGAIYTAPFTSRVYLSCVAQLDNIGAGHVTGNFYFVTSNRTYNSYNINPAAMTNAGFLGVNMSQIADMDAADTAKVTINISGSTKTVDIITATYFSGYQIC